MPRYTRMSPPKGASKKSSTKGTNAKRTGLSPSGAAHAKNAYKKTGSVKAAREAYFSRKKKK